MRDQKCWWKWQHPWPYGWLNYWTNLHSWSSNLYAQQILPCNTYKQEIKLVQFLMNHRPWVRACSGTAPPLLVALSWLCPVGTPCWPSKHVNNLKFLLIIIIQSNHSTTRRAHLVLDWLCFNLQNIYSLFGMCAMDIEYEVFGTTHS